MKSNVMFCWLNHYNFLFLPRLLPLKGIFLCYFQIEKHYKHKPDIGRIIIKLEVIKDEKQGKENGYGPCPHCGNAIGKFMCYA